MVRSDFAARRQDAHLALVAALREACEFCDQPENHGKIAATLERREFVGAPAEILQRGLAGQLDCGHGVSRRVNDFFVFHRDGANEPFHAQAGWALQLVRASGLCEDPAKLNFPLGRRVFRADLYEQAVKWNSTRPHHLNPTTENNHELNSELILA